MAYLDLETALEQQETDKFLDQFIGLTGTEVLRLAPLANFFINERSERLEKILNYKGNLQSLDLQGLAQKFHYVGLEFRRNKVVKAKLIPVEKRC